MSADPRIVVVTGASSGIGKAVALQASASGDHVVLIARGKVSLEHTATACLTSGAASALVLPADVGDDAAVAQCFEQTLERHGRIDAVVHCAGVVAYGRTEEVPVEVFDGVMRTNLTGSINVARHAVTLMRAQSAGSIILVGSVIGHMAVPSMSAYVLSKWGVRALARQLQLENRDLADVNIAYVAPGGVDTPIYEQAANYQGFVGRPPPPVDTPEKIARVLLSRIDNHRARTQVGVTNDLIRFGFSALPWAFDFLVGPLYKFAASDRTQPTDAVEGNVLAPVESGNQLRGSSTNPLAGLGRNATTLLKGLTGRSQ